MKWTTLHAIHTLASFTQRIQCSATLFIDAISIDQSLKEDALPEQGCLFTDLHLTSLSFLPTTNGLRLVKQYAAAVDR